MQQTLFSLLTNKDFRHDSVVQASLDREFAAGAQWFDFHIENTAGETPS